MPKPPSSRSGSLPDEVVEAQASVAAARAPRRSLVPGWRGRAWTIARSFWLNLSTMLLVGTLDALWLWAFHPALDLSGMLWSVLFVLAFPLALGALLAILRGVIVHAVENTATRKRDRRALYYWACLVALPVAIVADFVRGHAAKLPGTALAFVGIGLAAAVGVALPLTKLGLRFFDLHRDGHRAPLRMRALAAALPLLVGGTSYWLDQTLLVGLYPHLHWLLALLTVGGAQLFALVITRGIVSLRRPAAMPNFKSMLGPRLRLIAAVVLALGVLVAVPGFATSGEQVQRIALEKTAIESKVLGLARDLCDFDKDGYSFAVGGGDCDDTDPKIHPGALDQPGNGIDEDCSGGDFVPAKVAAPVASPAAPLAAPAPSPAAAGTSNRLNLLLITVDTVRADHLGLYGYGRRTTPNLDAFGEQSVVFERAYAQASETGTSLPSLLTSRYMSTSAWSYPAPCGPNGTPGRAVWPSATPGGVETLADILTRNGYDTGMISMIHDMVDGGMAQGFSTRLKPPYFYEQARTFLSAQRQRPFFFWLHETMPHDPYEKHEGYDFGDADLDLYDSEIAKSDEEIGTLLRHLTGLGLLENTVIVVTADHGEEFGEHGGRFHSTTLYEELLRVPLMIRVPGQKAARQRRIAELADIAPTVLAALKVDRGAKMLGKDLFSPAPSAKAESAYAERAICGQVLSRAFVREHQKLILNAQNNTVELYDLAEDPKERRNWADARPQRVRQMRDGLNAFLLQAAR